MPITNKSVQGVIDALGSGNVDVDWTSLANLPRIKKPVNINIPDKIVPANDVLGRIYFSMPLEFQSAYVFVETGSCTLNLSINGGASFILQNVTATPSSTTLSLSTVVAANDWAKLDITAADPNTSGLTIILSAVTDFANTVE